MYIYVLNDQTKAQNMLCGVEVGTHFTIPDWDMPQEDPHILLAHIKMSFRLIYTSKFGTDTKDYLITVDIVRELYEVESVL